MAKPDLRTAVSRATLDPQKLAHFIAVYDHGTFSGAASANGVSQQAVSKSIARLEEELGVPLFERSSFGATPTRFGEVLARRAHAIVAESRMAAAELEAMRGAGRGYLRVGLGWSLLVRIGPEAVRRFKERHPQVTVSIASGQSGELYRQLAAGDLELVISAPPTALPADSVIERTPLFIERDVLTVRRDHPITRKASLDLEDLTDYSWCISMQLIEQWERVCQTFLSRGIAPPTNIIDLNSILLVKSLIASSNGIGLLSPELFSQENETGLFTLIEDTPFTSERVAYLAVRKETEQQSFARYFRELVHQVWRELVPEEQHVA
ncbi:LysR family transcriptional regulator [Aurantiacibacter gangjinensis]|uniref:LysR family transcriptional regulator n=1 Tax=Aurantiacibacter gangjinensis TaxID=502682 RepID=UPI00069C05B6|nr:LysR family transcriptional regulator [Aurantiacibacter gangjinensis]APE28105.1 putative lysR-family transcriptional regulator [Aurantiacibacter gangjinensis]